MSQALPENKKSRLQHVDIARGISIICIILGHLGISQINRVVYTFHVPIFFFITGFFLQSGGDEISFIKKKARTILVPYAVICGVIIVLGSLKSLCFSGIEDARKSVVMWFFASLYGAGGKLSRFFDIKGIGAIWFLWATFWGSVLLHRLLVMNARRRIAAILIIFSLCKWSVKYFWLPMSIQPGGVALLFMYFGYCLHLCIKLKRDIPNEVKIVWTLFAFVVWFAFIRDFQSFWLVQCDMGRGIIDVFGCICACYCIVFVSKIININFQWLSDSLAYLGKYSIIVLCVHSVHIVELDVLPWHSIIKMLNSVGIPDDLNTALLNTGKLVLDIGVSVALSKSAAIRKIFAIK